MLSPVIKKLLEEELGREIRYSLDFESLSFDIEKKTAQKISMNTMKRLFGQIDGIKEPRLFTLDTIALYLHYRNWDEMLDSLNKKGNSDFSTIEEIEIDKLRKGDKIKFHYSPDREVKLEYIEKNQFKVIESLNSKLIKDDLIEINHFVLNYPLVVDEVLRNGIVLGKFTAGKVSGITRLILIYWCPIKK